MVFLKLLVNVPDVCVDGQRWARFTWEMVKVSTMGVIGIKMVMHVGTMNLLKLGPAIITRGFEGTRRNIVRNGILEIFNDFYRYCYIFCRSFIWKVQNAHDLLDLSRL